MTISIADALRAGSMRLQAVADNPRLEARLLLAHALGLTPNDLIRDQTSQIDPTAYYNLLARRLCYEPIAHLLGHREFWSLDFQVSPATLIPRPDSETLIESAITTFGTLAPRRILDLGTGTGCLLLSLLHVFQDAIGVGVDLEPEAAKLAKINADRLGFSNRASFAVMSWTDALSCPAPADRFDLVVSNPPYIPAEDIAHLMPDVARFEPRLALDGGADGLSAHRAIIGCLPRILASSGTGILELGVGQADFVTNLAVDAGFAVSIQLDLAQIPRAIVLTQRSG